MQCTKVNEIGLAYLALLFCNSAGVRTRKGATVVRQSGGLSNRERVKQAKRACADRRIAKRYA